METIEGLAMVFTGVVLLIQGTVFMVRYNDGLPFLQSYAASWAKTARILTRFVVGSSATDRRESMIAWTLAVTCLPGAVIAAQIFSRLVS